MPKVLVTARSFRKMQGDHWRVLQEAGYEIVTPEQDQPLKEAEMITACRRGGRHFGGQ